TSSRKRRIMDVQLKTLTLARAATEKVDALIVLTTGAHADATGPLAELLTQVQRAGDLPAKAGKLLALYRPTGISAPRVLLVSVGDGSAAATRSAVGAAIAAAKASQPKKLALVFAQQPAAEALRAAVLA